MIKDLLVPVVLGKPVPDAIDAACALAARFDGRVTALVAVSTQTPPSTTWDYYPEGIYETLHEAARSAAEAIARDVRSVLAKSPVPSEVTVADAFWMTAPTVAAAHAGYSDLVVLGRTPDALPEVERALFADLLLDTGRPILVVPSGCSWPEELGRAMVAWRPGPEANRALHDAMPLLKLAATVDLVMVEPKPDETANGALSGIEIAEHLARHDLRVNVSSIARDGQTTGAALLRFAQENGAQMIVAGGFSHSRMREMVFGGVTRTLYESARVPVLFSH